jgi:transposase
MIEVRFSIIREGEVVMESITAGVDLAKRVFTVCQVDDKGRVVGRRELGREGFREWLAAQPPGTVVAMEACSSAHYWGRQCQALGLEPKLMAAQFVKPFRKSARIKNDQQDAEAIATAARQGNMRFVTVKDEAQQVRLSWHRVREGYKKDALALRNRLRGLLAEFGVVPAPSVTALKAALADLDSHALPASLCRLIRLQQAHLAAIEDGLADCDAQIMAQAAADERCEWLRELTGIGPVTSDAVVASVGNAAEFRNGRQFAAWMGLTPTQFGTGGKVTLGHISCRGDRYLRTLLIQGARSSLQRAKATPADKATPEQLWIVQLAARMPYGKVLVAIANKHARQVWAMLARGERYDPEAWLKHPMVQRS